MANEIQVDVREPLYNTSFIFTPEGTIHPTVIKKSYPIASELPFVKPFPIDQLKTYNLSFGRTAVLVCADSWYQPSYEAIKRDSAEIILVGSYCAINKAMGLPWRGYDGSDEPADVDTNDIQTISEREAWIKYALPGKIKSTQAKIGVNVFLRGKLWDLGEDGQPIIVRDGEILTVGETEKAGIWNICF
jgi:hypothetical protein